MKNRCVPENPEDIGDRHKVREDIYHEDKTEEFIDKGIWINEAVNNINTIITDKNFFIGSLRSKTLYISLCEFTSVKYYSMKNSQKLNKKIKF